MRMTVLFGSVPVLEDVLLSCLLLLYLFLQVECEGNEMLIDNIHFVVHSLAGSSELLCLFPLVFVDCKVVCCKSLAHISDWSQMH